MLSTSMRIASAFERKWPAGRMPWPVEPEASSPFVQEPHFWRALLNCRGLRR